MRWTLPTLVALAGCTTDLDCDERIVQADGFATEDAASCTFAPERIDNPYCSGDDARPLLRYHLAWCTVAEPSCIDATYTTFEACYGTPTTRALARVQATGREGDWVGIEGLVVKGLDQVDGATLTVQEPLSERSARGVRLTLADGADRPALGDRVNVVGPVVELESGALVLDAGAAVHVGEALAPRPVEVTAEVAASGAYAGTVVSVSEVVLTATADCPDDACGETEGVWSTDEGLLVSDRFVTEEDVDLSTWNGRLDGVIVPRGAAFVLCPRDAGDLP